MTAKAGTCKTGYTKSTLLPKAEQEKLEKVLPYIDYEAAGVDKKPTIQFSGVNLQVIEDRVRDHRQRNREPDPGI